MNWIGNEGQLLYGEPTCMSFGSGSTLWAVARSGGFGQPWDETDLVTLDIEAGGVVHHQVGGQRYSINMHGLAIDSLRSREMVVPTFVD